MPAMVDTNSSTLIIDDRPKTILRLSPIGECFAMILAVTSIFTSLAWVAAAWNSPVSWFITGACLWIVLRISGVGSGRLDTSFVTICLTTSALYLHGDVEHTIPNWLSISPFSMTSVVVMLAIVFIVDGIDIFRNPTSRAQETCLQLIKLPGTVLQRYWGWGLVMLFAVYMVIIPGLSVILEQFQTPQFTSTPLEKMTFQETVRLRTTEAFTALWFFVFGATIGSYLNVIVYRTPRGESLIRQRSACPQCGSQIAGRDNIPVLGWLWLKGKCRDCQMPISSRYPIVEATTDALFLLFYFVELLSGGANLPVRTPNHYAGVVWIIFYTKWDIIGLYLYHSLLLVALLTWSLIRFDQQHVPCRSYVTTFLLALVPLLIWPELQLVTVNSESSATVGITLLSAGVGAVVGFVLGSITINFLTNKSLKKSEAYKLEFVCGLALTGAILGWQAACSVLAITLIIRLIQFAIAQWKEALLLKWHLTGCLLLATVLQLWSWRLQATYLKNFWPVLGFSLVPILAWISLTLSLVLILRKQLKPRIDESPESTNSLSIDFKQESSEWTH